MTAPSLVRALATVAMLAASLTHTLAAQPATARPVADSSAGTIPFFPLGPGFMALRGPARPGTYLSAVGRRAIAMGTEDGRFEFWSWPIKWLHDFELSFRVPKYTEPIAGHTIATAVTERAEGVTIEYTYEQFTVKQHVFVPLDKPAVIMLLEVDAIRPIDIIARFTPDVHFMWPASLGGQYLVWNQAAKAFLFSESKRRVNAFLGSPAITQASDVPAHMLAAAPPQFVLGVGGSGQRYTAPRLGEPPGGNIDARVAYIPIVLSGGAMSRDSALALYQQLMAPGAAEREWKARVAHADSIRQLQFAVTTPDPLLDRAVEYAKINLDESMVCNPDLGCGLVAGYGLSGGASDRPGFGWFFGGDAAINSFAMSGAGQSALVRDGVLRFFARYQRGDGKITHEISQGAGHVDWFSYPYAFYHGDTSPFWILAFSEYWRQTDDTALLRELWPNLKRAYQWSLATDKNGDGLMENPSAGAGALELGDLQVGILSDIYMSGVWAAALDRVARMAEVMGERAIAVQARQVRTKALATLETKFWMPTLGQYAFALLEDGSVNPNVTAWAATAMAFGVLDGVKGAQMAATIASSNVMTDWGARPLSAASTLFDPLHYNNGAVWPFVTGFTSLAQYAYHNANAGKFALDAVARTGFDFSRGRNPEVLSGRLYKPLDTAVPQQFFATSMVLTPLLRGLLGIDVDLPARTLRIAPHLPADWDSITVYNVPVGADRLTFRVVRADGALTLNVEPVRRLAAPLALTFAPALPLGARVALPDSAVTRTPGDVHGAVRMQLTSAGAELRVPYTGGWSIVPAVTAGPYPGARSTKMRVISERMASGTYVATLEGRAGSEGQYVMFTPDRTRAPVVAASAGASVQVGARAAGTAKLMLSVTFPTAGANADGYTTTTLSFTQDDR
ncbi:MAG: GH116 family glycosyl hydrolase [Gemmatimonadota bacterium]